MRHDGFAFPAFAIGHIVRTVQPTPIEPQKVELVLAQLDALPALAPVVTRILALTKDEAGSMRELAQLVASDPSLAARALAICGKAATGVRSAELTVERAVGLIGFKTIRQVTLASKVMEAFASPRDPADGPGIDRPGFWQHCLAVACAARRIAAALPEGLDAEEAFLLGLLHDIGKLALDCALPKSYARVLRRREESRSALSDAERTVLGIDHTVAGRRLAERWGLPSRLVDCIWLHHHQPEALPPAIAHGRHVQIVQLADVMAREHRIGFSGNDHVPIASRTLAERMGLSEAARVGIIEALAGELEERAAWIGQEETSSREVYVRALLRTSEELSTANASLQDQNQQLHRKMRYFAAMDHLNQVASPRQSPREVCAIGAAALQLVLPADRVAVYCEDAKGAWVSVGLSGNPPQSRIEACPAEVPDATRDVENAMRLAVAGAWISQSGRSVDWLSDRLRSSLGEGSTWLLPILCRREWVGAAIFVATPADVSPLSAESVELAALSNAVGLAVRQAQSQAAAQDLAEDLAEANRRLADIQPELVKIRTLESLAALAAGAAHELNNPLAVISGRAQQLRSVVAAPEVQAGLSMIAEKAQTASDIVTQLMAFADPEPMRPELVNVERILSDLRSELAIAGLLDASRFMLEVQPGCPPVWFDPACLRRLLGELIDNSIEATVQQTRQLAVKANGNLTEDSIVVQVVDNGRGMTPDALGRAFDPFYSHRPAGRGRGLGLSRVQRWLHAGGGTIRIDSEPGRGTRVELRLPTRRESQDSPSVDDETLS